MSLIRRILNHFTDYNLECEGVWYCFKKHAFGILGCVGIGILMAGLLPRCPMTYNQLVTTLCVGASITAVGLINWGRLR